jgi:hypothetical protein
MCNHDWQPISGWYARYRCSHCAVVGCKFGVVTGYGSLPSSRIAARHAAAASDALSWP